MSLPFGILFLKNTYSDYRLKTKWIETVWTVTNSKVEYRTEDRTYYSISLKYDCGSNKWIEKEGINTSTIYYNVGDYIVLYCDEDEPWKFVFKEKESFIGMLWFILTFFMPWFVIFLTWVKRVLNQSKTKKGKQKLVHSGTKVEATIIDIYQSDVRFDYKLWFKIVAQYWDDVFESEDIYADIYYLLDIWDNIDVYFDKWDFSKYWMDIDKVLERDCKISEIRDKKWWLMFVFLWIITLLFFIYGWIFLFLFIALFCFLIWIKRLRCSFWIKQMKENLVQSGKIVEATVLLVLSIPSKHRWGNNKYKVVAKYNGKTYLSEEYSEKFKIKIKKWDKIDVYLDELDHSKYWVDVDTLFGKKIEKIEKAQKR